MLSHCSSVAQTFCEADHNSVVRLTLSSLSCALSTYVMGTWQVRESMYQSLGLMATSVGAFYACGAGQGLWGPGLMEHVDCMDHQHLRMMLRHLMLSFTRICPPQHRCGCLSLCWCPSHCPVLMPSCLQARAGVIQVTTHMPGMPFSAVSSQSPMR